MKPMAAVGPPINAGMSIVRVRVGNLAAWCLCTILHFEVRARSTHAVHRLPSSSTRTVPDCTDSRLPPMSMPTWLELVVGLP